MSDVSPLMLTPVFLGLAIIFVGVAVQDYLKAEGKLSPGRKTWLRIAFIFSAVSIGLFVVNNLLM